MPRLRLPTAEESSRDPHREIADGVGTSARFFPGADIPRWDLAPPQLFACPYKWLINFNKKSPLSSSSIGKNLPPKGTEKSTGGSP